MQYMCPLGPTSLLTFTHMKITNNEARVSHEYSKNSTHFCYFSEKKRVSVPSMGSNMYVTSSKGFENVFPHVITEQFQVYPATASVLGITDEDTDELEAAIDQF